MSMTEKKTKWWYGIEGIYFIWHNEWADPEIEMDGEVLNMHDVEDSMWERFNEDGYADPELFPQYMKENEEEVKEEFRIMVELYKKLNEGKEI